MNMNVGKVGTDVWPRLQGGWPTFGGWPGSALLQRWGQEIIPDCDHSIADYFLLFAVLVGALRKKLGRS